MSDVSPAPTRDWRVAPCIPSDVPFIINSWAADASVYESRQANEDPEVFKVGQRERILRLIQANNCVSARPCESEDSATNSATELFGFICYGLDRKTLRPVIHFVYVKKEHRGRKIASTLLKIAGVRPEKASWCTTQRIKTLKPQSRRGLMFNRFLLDYDPGAKPEKWRYP